MGSGSVHFRPVFLCETAHVDHSNHQARRRKLKDELHRLKHVERPPWFKPLPKPVPRVTCLKTPNTMLPKDKQGFIEGRINEIEGKLSAAQIIDPSALDAGGRVCVRLHR